MKMTAEYLERALEFERLATLEENPQVKTDLEKQAAAYRKLAAVRANWLGRPSPPIGPEDSI
jgi:hypothetical protein